MYKPTVLHYALAELALEGDVAIHVVSLAI